MAVDWTAIVGIVGVAGTFGGSFVAAKMSAASMERVARQAHEDAHRMEYASRRANAYVDLLVLVENLTPGPPTTVRQGEANEIGARISAYGSPTVREMLTAWEVAFRLIHDVVGPRGDLNDYNSEFLRWRDSCKALQDQINQELKDPRPA